MSYWSIGSCVWSGFNEFSEIWWYSVSWVSSLVLIILFCKCNDCSVLILTQKQCSRVVVIIVIFNFEWVCSAMSCELVLNTLQGDFITLEVLMDNTVGELKAMLLDYKTEDPIERQIITVELLQDCSIMEMDDSQELGKTGLLEAEARATVIYEINKVEAATQAEVETQGLFHLNIPPDLTTISGSVFQECKHLVSVALTQSVTHIGDYAFTGCSSLSSITLGDSVTHVGQGAFEGCSSLSSITFGDSLTHWGRCLSTLRVS